jgi:hypothetical protein
LIFLSARNTNRSSKRSQYPLFHVHLTIFSQRIFARFSAAWPDFCIFATERGEGVLRSRQPILLLYGEEGHQNSPFIEKSRDLVVKNLPFQQ